jgi:outer membrane protein assembly factor BamB
MSVSIGSTGIDQGEPSAEVGADGSDEAAAAQPPVADPLAGYLARMRRQRWIYVAALAVVTILIVTLVQVVLRTGEISHAALHPASTALPAPPSGPISTTLTPAWHSSDATAGGLPFDGGTVVTYNAHTVSGRNYSNGDAVWTYTRTDVSICTVYQQVDVTLAIFTDHDGYCDEVDAFKTGTGARDWTRTLDSNGNTIYGKPVFTFSQYTLMITTPQYTQALDPVSAIDRWTFIEPSGCTTTSAIGGSGGVLISQHCADGDHLLLRDAYAGDVDNDKAKSLWRISSNAVPVSADALIAAIDPSDHKLLVYDAGTHQVTATQTLDPTPSLAPTTVVRPVVAGSDALIPLAATIYALDSKTGRQLWTVPAGNPPTTQTPGATLIVTGTAIEQLNSDTGQVTSTYAIGAAPAGSSAFRFGTGFIVAGSSTAVYR